jgi:hypothetical protein
VFRGGDTLQHGLVLEHREQGVYESTWTAVWGPQRHVRDHHRWLRNSRVPAIDWSPSVASH